MEVELKRVPREWHYHDCTEKKNLMRKNEETRWGKRKAESSIDPFEVTINFLLKCKNASFFIYGTKIRNFLVILKLEKICL